MEDSTTPAAKPGGLPWKTAVVTTIGLYKTCVGNGMLSMPKALSSSGYVVFGLLLFGFSFLSWYSCCLVARTIDILQNDDLDPAKVGEKALGRVGKWVSVALVFLDPWGSVMAFFSTLADTIIPMLEEPNVIGKGKVWTDDAMVVLILAVLIFPFMLSKDVGELGWVNIFGVVSLVGFVAAVVIHAAQDGKGFSPLDAANANSDTIVALNVIAFAYDGCQMNVFPFYPKLEGIPVGQRAGTLSRMTAVSNFFAAASYLAVALLAYSVYQEDTHNNVLKNLGNDAVQVAIKIALCVSILLSIPITLFECSSVLREHVFGEGRWTNVLLNIALVGSAGLLAVLVKDMYAAFAYVGATTATAWTMILPPVWFIYTVKAVYGSYFPTAKNTAINDDEEDATPASPLLAGAPPPPSRFELLCAWVLLVLGCVAMPIFLYSTVISSGDGSDSSGSATPFDATSQDGLF